MFKKSFVDHFLYVYLDGEAGRVNVGVGTGLGTAAGHGLASERRMDDVIKF